MISVFSCPARMRCFLFVFTLASALLSFSAATNSNSSEVSLGPVAVLNAIKCLGKDSFQEEMYFAKIPFDLYNSEFKICKEDLNIVTVILTEEELNKLYDCVVKNWTKTVDACATQAGRARRSPLIGQSPIPKT